MLWQWTRVHVDSRIQPGRTYMAEAPRSIPPGLKRLNISLITPLDNINLIRSTWQFFLSTLVSLDYFHREIHSLLSNIHLTPPAFAMAFYGDLMQLSPLRIYYQVITADFKDDAWCKLPLWDINTYTAHHQVESYSNHVPIAVQTLYRPQWLQPWYHWDYSYCNGTLESPELSHKVAICLDYTLSVEVRCLLASRLGFPSRWKFYPWALFCASSRKCGEYQ